MDEMSDTTETCAGETHRRKLMNSRRKNRVPYKFLLKVHPFGQVEWTCRLVQVPPGSLKSIQTSGIQTYIWRFGHIKVQMQINIPVLPRLSRKGQKHFALSYFNFNITTFKRLHASFFSPVSMARISESVPYACNQMSQVQAL